MMIWFSLTLRAKEMVSIHMNHRSTDPVNVHLSRLCIIGAEISHVLQMKNCSQESKNVCVIHNFI